MNGVPHKIGSVLIGLVGILLLGSAAAKLAHVPKVVAELAAMGFEGHKLTFVAFLEVASAVLLLIPITRSMGLLLVSSFMGGVIATHLGHDSFPSIAGPSVILILLWVGTALRHDQVLWSVRTSAPPSVRAAVPKEIS